MRLTAFLPTLSACLVLAACSPRTEPEPPAEPQPLSADMMANLMAADGAAHTVAVLTGPADPTGIDKVFAGIASGDPEWLALVPTLQPALDGEHAEGLQHALAAALPLNPAGVLTLLPDYAHPDTVCAPTAPADARTAAARAAVEAVANPPLQAARSECMGFLDGVKPARAEPMQR